VFVLLEWMQYNRTSILSNKEKQLNLIHKRYVKNSQAVKQGAALCKMTSMKLEKLWNTGGGQEMAVMVGQWQEFY